MKVTARDVIHLMRLFEKVDDDVTSKDIEQLTITHPRTTNTLASFVYNKKQYALLNDEVLDDDINAIAQMVAVTHPGAVVESIINPHETETTYGIPYHGKQWYLVTLNEHTERLDSYLARTRPDYSRASWQHFITDGRVLVNDRVCTRSKQPVTLEDKVDFIPPDGKATGCAPDIIYQDEDSIVINKPVGMLTHPKNERDDEFSVEHFLRTLDDNTLGQEQRYGIVHRLDRDTSGVLIAAKTIEGFELLKQQFAQRRAQKTYYALTSAIPRPPEAMIDVPIARSTKEQGTFIPSSHGKSAQTVYRIIETNGNKALVRLKPKTGRTHQLRVHLAYVKAPIIGDRLYNTSSVADRLYLHAEELVISTPRCGKQTFTAALPKVFYTELTS